MNNSQTLSSPNRVPLVDTPFWIIKLMAVTMGETAADFLAVNLGFGLTTTSFLMFGILIVALYFQFKQKVYVPWAYWLGIVLVSVVGTLITDNLHDNFGISLVPLTIGFTIALSACFYLWYKSEGTLSIHEVKTDRREMYYWLAILLTFALGTAAGDLVAETFQLGFSTSVVFFAMIIGSLFIGYKFLNLDPILGFWLAYIFTRPLGASFGDLLSQPSEYGGMGFGTIATSIGFLVVIALTVFVMTKNQARSN